RATIGVPTPRVELPLELVDLGGERALLLRAASEHRLLVLQLGDGLGALRAQLRDPAFELVDALGVRGALGAHLVELAAGPLGLRRRAAGLFERPGRAPLRALELAA